MVYAKRPFAGPQQVLDYVGRYTHRVAISNNRLLDIEDGQVRFQWKDYRDEASSKTMTLSAEEFIRRFLLHVLPDGFQRIRYYGFLGNRYREEKLAVAAVCSACRSPTGRTTTKKDYRDRYEELTGDSLHQCPQCKQGRMLVVEILPRGPVPNLRRSLTPHDPSNRLRFATKRPALSGPHRKCACFALTRPVTTIRPLILRCTRAVTSETVPLHSQSRHACNIYPLSRQAGHSKPIGRTVVERFSPTRF